MDMFLDLAGLKVKLSGLRCSAEIIMRDSCSGGCLRLRHVASRMMMA